MSSSMEPIIKKVHSNKAKIPCSRMIPRQIYQTKLVVNKHIESHNSNQNNNSAKFKKRILFN